MFFFNKRIAMRLTTKMLGSVLFSLSIMVSQTVLADTNAEQNSQASEDSQDLVSLVFSNDVEIAVEFANDPQSRALGLMYRRQMCKDCGMLFKFDSVRIATIWMKNTYIPLDLAYINAFGTIVDIKPLTPHDLTSVPSSVPVLYALEMNQGWFAQNGLSVGDTVKLPSHIR
jgi:uncharacterized membrane protein (UPF0127 family)